MISTNVRSHALTLSRTHARTRFSRFVRAPGIAISGSTMYVANGGFSGPASNSVITCTINGAALEDCSTYDGVGILNSPSFMALF